ncbi:hypothetical protein [Bacillus sp. OV166]|uniref:hypothetical protein n=1 Tax=Bacillus sp. OV166 TaxID=1882763 RepID=UPI00211B2C11|nr:hypothetical protein [Bacillus sp. OV166]
MLNRLGYVTNVKVALSWVPYCGTCEFCVTREVHLCESALGPMFEGKLLDGNVKPFRDFPIIAEMYLDGKFKLDELALNRIALEDINQPFKFFP